VSRPASGHSTPADSEQEHEDQEEQHDIVPSDSSVSVSVTKESLPDNATRTSVDSGKQARTAAKAHVAHYAHKKPQVELSPPLTEHHALVHEVVAPHVHPKSEHDAGNPLSKHEMQLNGLAVPAASSLIIHATDLAVRPLVGNAKIEKVTPPKVMLDQSGNVRNLSFKGLTAAQVLKLDQKQLEAFLTSVFKQIGGGTTGAVTLSKRASALSYLQNICTDTQVANIVINSSLMKLFVKMLKVFRSASLKVHLLNVMSTLLRFATFISDDVSGCGVVFAFADLLKSTHVSIKRRATCALGELLFYIAAQDSGLNAVTPTRETKNDPEAKRGGWRVPDYGLALLQKCLKPGEVCVCVYVCVYVCVCVCVCVWLVFIRAVSW
jgi:hypothetical protein